MHVVHRAAALASLACLAAASAAGELEPPGRGELPVGSTHFVVAAEHADIGDDRMEDYLVGRSGWFTARYVTDVLEAPDAAWVVDVPVPEDDAYGPASGEELSVAAFVTYPSDGDEDANRYEFPYSNGQYGVFEDMLRPGEAPRFADDDARYPLIVLAHGASAHGVYDVRHAHELSRHGFIVAVLFYGDDRTRKRASGFTHLGFLRALLTRAAVDSLLESDGFGPHIDAERIGISGHSFGGFTALAAAGGRYLESPATVHASRVTAAVLAAPWVGDVDASGQGHAFGPGNRDLKRVTAPMLTLFGTSDDVTKAADILPATRMLGGPSYVVELVDQPHVFEGGSWVDRDNWELLFFTAYLKDDPAARAALARGTAMQGGNEDVQLFDYQRLPESAE